MNNAQRFHDRREAGHLLALRLADYKDCDNVVVLALPRGGVPVGYEIARMGAIAGRGSEVLNSDVVAAYNIRPHVIRAVAEREGVETFPTGV
jgi:predicted phosphoribosyltransferase